MILRESARGSSFKGAGLYFLHDKNALTSRRVAFTHCENLPTQNPGKALGWMAWTHKIAPDLKRQAGVAASGRQGTMKPVLTVALAWHPEQKPTRQEMIEQGRAWLKEQKLQEHQVVMVAHTDRDHPHLHLIVNLVHPTTGRVNRLSYSRLKSSRFAQDFEQANGKVYCQQRVENNRQRDKGKRVKYSEERLATKDRIASLYRAADSGKAFQAALRENGLALAKGRAIVVIDRAGKIYGLVRQLGGVKSKEVAAKLKDIRLPDVAQAQQQLPGGSDRNRIEMEPGRVSPIKATNELKMRQHQELTAFRDQTERKKEKLAEQLEQQYGRYERELKVDIAALEQGGRFRGIPQLLGKLTGRAEQNAEALAGKRKTLENLQWRKDEAVQGFDKKIGEQRKEMEARHRLEWRNLDQGTSSKPHNPARDEFEAALERERTIREARAAQEREKRRDRSPDR